MTNVARNLFTQQGRPRSKFLKKNSFLPHFLELATLQLTYLHVYFTDFLNLRSEESPKSDFFCISGTEADVRTCAALQSSGFSWFLWSPCYLERVMRGSSGGS